MTKFKKVFLLAFTASILFSCKKSNEAINKLEEPLKETKVFTNEDFQRIKTEVAQISKSISFAISKTKSNPNLNSRGNSINSSNSQNGCGSYYANEYNTTCFTGYATEFLVDENPNIYYTPSNIGLANNLDLNVVDGFNNFGLNGDPNYFLSQNQLTSNSETTMNSLGTEQSQFADSLQNISTLTDVAADQLMTAKVVEQENRILNNPALSYEDKEYVLTTLELQLQNKENYMNSYENAVENSQSRRRTFLGKLWRGLAFVAITVATAGKAAIFIAKAAYIIAGNSAIWAASAAALKTSYFALGVAAAWVPTGAELVNKQKWNENPWKSGSFSDFMTFGGKIIGIVTNPFFGWQIV
ncbi:MAG: hypothetical protein H7174_03800 [Flavobacterium sp.]|nr:hypothetical protein [Flavobacterium sp.]